MSDLDYVVTIEDGTTTVTLTSSPFGLSGFDPRSEDPDTKTVTHTLEARVTDGSSPNNLDEGRTIRKLLRQAKEAQADKNIAKVYVTFKESAAADKYRSEIIKGKADWADRALDFPYWKGNTHYLVIDIERENSWEGPEAQLDLDNANGTDNTSGLNIFNCNDEDGISPNIQVNYVAVDGADIGGDLMSPTRLELTNTYAEALSSIHIGQNWTDPANMAWHFEGEDATAGASVVSSSNQADATQSNDSYKAVEIGSGGEVDALKWALTAAQVAAISGRYIKAFIKFQGFTSITDTWFRFKVRKSGSTPDLWKMQSQVKPSSSVAVAIRDIFTFPVGLVGLSNQQALDLWLSIEQSTGSNVTYRIDFIELMPVDGYRYLQVAGGMNQNERLVDEGISGDLYVDDGAGSSKRQGIQDGGASIMLYPGVNQRLYFLQNGTGSNNADVERSMSVKLYYRPRRLSL